MSIQNKPSWLSDGSDAVGFIQFWGNSPAFNLTELLNSDSTTEESNGVSMLLSGAADIRHLLQAAARKKRLKGKPVELYMHEGSVDTIARHILLLEVANNSELCVRERAELFLEIYGNTLVRERTAQYIAERVPLLIALVCGESNHPLKDMLDFSHLKFKERDALQDVFSAWRLHVPFDIEQLRDQRCRHFYGVRFDSRVNLIDWDFTQHAKPACAVLHWREYKQFALTGVCFDARLASYTHPNRTLASYIPGKDRKKGSTLLVRGYWGDIINSPFFAFGGDTDPQDRERLWRVCNSQQRYTCQDVAFFNLVARLTEIETETAFHLPPQTPDEGMYPFPSALDKIGGSLGGLDKLPEKSTDKNQRLEEIKEEDETDDTHTHTKPDAAPPQPATTTPPAAPLDPHEQSVAEARAARLNKRAARRGGAPAATPAPAATSSSSSATAPPASSNTPATQTPAVSGSVSSSKLLKGFEGMKVVFLTGDLAGTLSKPKYASKFDRAYIGNMSTTPLLKAGGQLITQQKAAEEKEKGEEKTAGGC